MNKLIDNKVQEGDNLNSKFEVASSLFGKGGLLEPKDEWDKLSMAAKAEMMRVAVNHGIYDLQTIRQKYNEFAEGGKKEDEQYYSTMEKVAEDNYKDWGFSNPDEALVHALNDNTYNYRDFYRKHPWSEANATTHWTDEFKTVWHPTFSNESIYSGQKSQYNPLGLPGGFWSGDTFIPMAWQMDANEYKKGGSIHIKPSHRGRLTELKKRTGKTEVELYNDGNPAHKKMVVFARNSRRWKHGDGGQLISEAINQNENLYGFGDWLDSIVNKGKQFVKRIGFDRSPGQHLQKVLTPTSDKKYRQNLYNIIDPTSSIPEGMDIIKYGAAALAAKYGGDYPYQRTKIDSVADAAWAKRLGLDYNQAALIDNGDGTVRLPSEVEAEIPTDTTALKQRIENNEKRLKQLHGKERRLTGAAIDIDREALDALRKTYNTGEPVMMDEHSHVSRNWQGLTPESEIVTPLNTLHRYTIQYDKNNNKMKYWDWYDFNEFEDFVPGSPFKIQGSIDLNKKQ